MADLTQIEQDIHELRERVAFLDGWRQGDSERYERLAQDIVGVKEELRSLSEGLGGRVDTLSGRVDTHFWMLAATFSAVVANLLVVVL